MREDVPFNKSMITMFRNSNLSLKELEVAGIAMLRSIYNEDYQFALIKAQPCDPNILGLISDFLLQVDEVKTCVVYNELPDGFKLSVRSCIRDVKACELVQIITDNIGSGGGHVIKAGGFIKKSMVTPTPEALEALFCERMIDYFKNTEIIETSNYSVNTEGMATYVKNNIFLGYVHVSDMYPIGTEVNIRTLEGDLDVTVDEDTYMVIGINGEVYPIRKEKLNSSYITTEVNYIFTGEYEPTIEKSDSGNSLSIIHFAKSCIATGGVEIMAKQINHRLKIFTECDEEKYLLGRPGDYMVVRKDDLKDVYIIDRDIFHKTYTRVY
jgi:phosphoglycolate phosphatase